MDIIINPGTGPVSQYGDDISEANAAYNAGIFTGDLADEGVKITCAGRCPGLDSEGRYGWELTTASGHKIEIEMPGLPLSQVRYMGRDEQNIWDYPRLYVDGSSWVWNYALSVCKTENQE